MYIDTKEVLSRGWLRGFIAAKMTRESPVVSHAFVVRAAVVNVILPNNIDIANEDIGTSANNEGDSSAVLIMVSLLFFVCIQLTRILSVSYRQMT